MHYLNWYEIYKWLIHKTIQFNHSYQYGKKSNIMSEKKIHNKFIIMIFMESQEFHYMTSVSMFYKDSQLVLVVNILINIEIHFVFIHLR